MPDANPMAAMMGMGDPTGGAMPGAGAGAGQVDPAMLLRQLARHGKKRRRGGGKKKSKR